MDWPKEKFFLQARIRRADGDDWGPWEEIKEEFEADSALHVVPLFLDKYKPVVVESVLITMIAVRTWREELQYNRER